MSVRRRSKTRQHLKLGAILFAVLFFVGGIVYAIWFSDLFTIQAIEVEGATLIDSSVISGPTEGNIIFWKTPIDVSQYPPVETIDVKKDYANRRINITVKERGKVMIWCIEADQNCYWADDNGFIFTSAPIPEGVLVVSVIMDYTNRELSVGDSVLPDELFKNLKYANELLESLDVSIKEIRIDDLKFKEATAVVSNGPEIYFSLAFDPRFGKGVLEALINSQDWGAIEYVDLTVENRAYYKLK